MQLISALAAPRSILLNRRNGAVAAVVGVGVAFSIALAADQQLSRAVADGVHDGINGVKTVAAMLAERSPGERPKGALAKLKQLKHRRAAAPLGRHILPPIAGLVQAPAVPLILPPAITPAPLYNVVAGGPPIVIPPVPITPGAGGGGGGGGGGPPIFGEIPPPGGGGGIITPPSIVTEVVPPPPPTSSVPEPASWAMMLAGFGMLGSLFRRQKRAGLRVANG